MLSVTWPADCTVPLPGGIPGASTSTTIGVKITLAMIQMTTRRRKWLTLSFIAAPHTTLMKPSM